MYIVEHTTERLLIRNGTHKTRPVALAVGGALILGALLSQMVFGLTDYAVGAWIAVAVSALAIAAGVTTAERKVLFDRSAGTVTVIRSLPYLRRHEETVRPLGDISGLGRAQKIEKAERDRSGMPVTPTLSDGVSYAVTLRWSDGDQLQITDHLGMVEHTELAEAITRWLGRRTAGPGES
ncbi:MAG: hypothetical protein AAF577_04820 [Pseudomonadota bacterium]